jgi:hypothetical protein
MPRFRVLIHQYKKWTQNLCPKNGQHPFSENDRLRSPDMRGPLTRTSLYFLPLAISMLWATSGATQEVVDIPDEVSCPE